jgi:hypothetical protein
MSSAISIMSSPADWDNRERLLNLLAHRLLRKRLSLFLGAGASLAFKLPSWTQLVDNLYAQRLITRSMPKDDTKDAENLLVAHYTNPDEAANRLAFAKDVQTELYQGYKHDQSLLEFNPLLTAIGALVMSSARGSVAQVMTLNYDDILEVYLSWRGLTVASVDLLPAWNSDADVEVLHPHGLLRSDMMAPRRGVVLTRLDYDKIVGDTADMWRQRMLGILRSTTCLFIGLSGEDANLSNMLLAVKQAHSTREPFWGVRFGCDGNGNTWSARGVYPLQLKNHDETPTLILDICRRAAELRMKRLA